MAKTETIIIDYKVNSDDAIKRMVAAEKALSDLKNQQKELQKQLKDGTITENEYANAITGIKTGIIEQTNILKANQKALNDNVREETAAAGSMNEMKAKLSEMSVAYQNLSAEERKSAGGKELLTKISDTSDELKKLEGEREVEELKKKLSEEKKMTKETRDAIQQTIVLTEANTAIQVARIREQQNQNTIQREYNAQKQILDAKLNLIKQCTEEELNINKQSLHSD